MTKSENARPTALPLLLVYGKPTGADLPQASWFRIEDRTAVTVAAHALKLNIIDVAAEEDRALLASVHEGVLKAGGRLIVGSVAVDVYKQIEEHAAKASSGSATGPKSTSEQNTNNPDKPLTARVGGPRAWDALRVGDNVVGKYWEEDGHPNGWWIGIVTAIDGNDFVIRWPDEPRKPPVKIERRHIAILDPSYDVNTEWQRRR